MATRWEKFWQSVRAVAPDFLKLGADSEPVATSPAAPAILPVKRTSAFLDVVLDDDDDDEEDIGLENDV